MSHASGIALRRAVLLSGSLALASSADRHVVDAARAEPLRLTVLIVNGGGTPSANYQAHLQHIRMLLDILRYAEVAERRITILSADGSDPAADLALREEQPEADFWRVTGTRLERHLRTPITYESSRIPGFVLKAATRAEIDRWFETVGSQLKQGDTLLLYVTDHGTKNEADSRDSQITLWGKGQGFSVGELRARLAKVDSRVRVVMLMSQCFSGSFANALPLGSAGLASGNVCGYFSTTADRLAYGCYPEARDQDNVGHSFDFMAELAQTGSFHDAHSRVVVNDATPDAPLRSSDTFLEELLKKRAAARGTRYDTLVDDLLAQAWKRKDTWEPEIRILDALGRNFGSFSPRSVDEIRDQEARLPEVGQQLDTHARAWKTTLGDANRANLDLFLAKKRGWAELVSESALRGPGSSARELAGSLVWELAEFTRADESMEARLSTLHERADTARALAYRMEVREGVLLRMRTILATIAGREYLSREGTAEERAVYESLIGCEALTLPLSRPVPRIRPVDRVAFRALEDDLQAAREVMPAWMGIRFAEAPVAVRKAHGLEPGAASLTAVYPDSPAEEAGLKVGDVVVGPPRAPFEDPRQIREWTMLATVDKPAELSVLRGDETLEVTLVPRPYPIKWPELAGPPHVSSTAPPWNPLQLSVYRGSLPPELKGGGPHLLYFWATWCGPCKAALPELLEFERERRTPVIAITDETGDALDAFFGKFDKPFPERVATDLPRRAFLAFGVSGTPTFVLVDGEGIVRSYSTGYSPARSLGIDGWTWPGKPAGAPASAH
jgi:thiol-disulfide isomerase/thioredoxin